MKTAKVNTAATRAAVHDLYAAQVEVWNAATATNAAARAADRDRERAAVDAINATPAATARKRNAATRATANATDRESAARTTAARAAIAAHKADRAADRAARKYAADPTPGNADKAARKARKADRAAAALTAANADRAAAENAATAARNAATLTGNADQRKATADRATADRRKAATDYAADIATAADRIRAARDKWTLTGDGDRDPLTLQAMAAAAVDSKLKFRANTFGKLTTDDNGNDLFKQGGEREQLQPADRDDLAAAAALAMWELYATGERDTATLYRAALASMDKFFRAQRRKAATPEYDPDFIKCNPDPRPMTPTPTSDRADRATRAAADRAAAVLDDLAAAVLDDLAAGMTPGNIRAAHNLTPAQYRRIVAAIRSAMLTAIDPAAVSDVVTPADYAATVEKLTARNGDGHNNGDPARKAAKAAAARARRAAMTPEQKAARADYERDRRAARKAAAK